MDFIEAIPYGRDNAISRAELARITGMSDRKLRDTIKAANAELIKNGEAIVSSSSVRGYWRTRNRAEMQRYLAESDHRIRMIFQNDAPIRTFLKQTELQLTFF